MSVTKRVQDRLAQVAETKQPFFWHVFYSCTHLPYRATAPYSSMFSDPAYEGPNKTPSLSTLMLHQQQNLEAKLAAMPPKEIQQIRALYDGCTRQFDDNALVASSTHSRKAASPKTPSSSSPAITAMTSTTPASPSSTARDSTAASKRATSR